MRIDLRYGESSSSVLLPDDADPFFLTVKAQPLDDPIATLRKSLERPHNSPALRDRLTPASRVLVLIADLTRGGPAKELLPPFLEYLTEAGVPSGSINVLVARGTHRELSEDERSFFKSIAPIKVSEHDCDDSASVSALLLTSRGTPVRVNRAIRDADLVVLFSSVSFHYFAGFGGGRKLVLPGSSDRSAIMSNHRLALLDTQPVQLHPECRPGNLSGNPVHEDMMEALAALPNTFAVNFFAASDGDAAFINAGDPVVSHAVACEAYRASHTAQVPQASGIVIVGCGGRPYDINLLQAHKALRHAAHAATRGAHILFYAECPEGIGSPSLQKALEGDHKKFLDSAWNDYGLNNQTAVSLLGLTTSHRVGLVSALDEEVVGAAGMVPCDNPEAFIAEAIDAHPKSSIAVMPYGGQCLPKLAKESL